MFIVWNIWYAKTRRWVEIYEVCTILYFILFYSRLLYTYCCTLIEPKRSLILKNCSQTIIRTTLTVNMQYRIHSSTYTVNQMNSWVTKPKTSRKFLPSEARTSNIFDLDSNFRVVFSTVFGCSFRHRVPFFIYQMYRTFCPQTATLSTRLVFAQFFVRKFIGLAVLTLKSVNSRRRWL